MHKVAPFVTCISLFLASVSWGSPLRLNEFMAGPASDWNGDGTFSSRDDEWIEVVNTGVAPLDLGAHFITDDSGTPRYGFSGILDPGALLLVYGGDAYDWERATGHPAFGLALGNSGDTVQLWEIASGETLLVDEYTYGSHAAAADRAVGRTPDGSGEWGLFDGLNPYSGSAEPSGTGCDPTPGTANVCSSTPTRSATWGRIKTMYR